MNALTRLRLALRPLVGAGALVLPACAAFDSSASPTGSSAPSPKMTRPVRPYQQHAVIPVGATVPDAMPQAAEQASALPQVPPAAALGRPLPINLPTALALTRIAPLDIQIAEERLRAASAAHARANVLWLPNLGIGVDYYRHDGQIQDIVGTVFTTSRSSFLVGAGPTAVFPVSDALYAPLAAKQLVRARRADAQAARNDTTLAVAEAYFTVQQARGELAGALDALRRAEELVKVTEKVSPDYAPAVEVNRVKVEVARRRQSVETAYERWQVASADLARVLRLEPGTLVEPEEVPSLVVELLDPDTPAEELLPVALTHRPELAADQALIQAALVRVRQEKMRPLTPTLAARGLAGPTPGLAGGYFGGGVNGDVSNFGSRFSIDLQAIWELNNLGLGNRAIIREREAEQRQSLLRLLRTQDQITAEVMQAVAQLRASARRLKAASEGVAHAVESAEKNLRGVVPGKRIGDQLTLVFRPQEAVSAVAALDQAYRDYFAAVGDHNRAQFRLYRALGHPAQMLGDVPTRTGTVPAISPSALPQAAPVPAPVPQAAAPIAVVPASHTTTAPVPLPAPPAPAKPPAAEEPVWRAVGSPPRP